MSAHELFDDAIFQRVEADDRQTTADFQGVHGRFQTAFQITQLVIDLDAQALKCTGRRVLALFPGRVGHGQHLGQVSGTGKRLLGTAQHHGARHALGEALFAIFFKGAGDVFFAGAGDPLGRTDTAARVHAHVQRTVMHKAEAALRVI